MQAEIGLRPNTFGFTLDRGAVLAFALLSAIYVLQAVTLAASAPFWMDEILTLWAAKLPSMSAIWFALTRGAEFTPPLFDWLIHALHQAGVSSALGLRMPSIIAIYIAALATGSIALRHVGIAPAALAAGVVLSSGLFGYAVQMRPYALVTAAFACALALYERPGRPTLTRLTGIAALLALAIGLHFYALLLAIGLGVLELTRARTERRPPCWRTLAAIAVAGVSILLWLPILLAARAYSAGDVLAVDYYARPGPFALVRSYAVLLGWLIVPLIALLAVSVVGKREIARLRTVALVIAAAPIGIFAFALLVSHSYADRYALAGGIGIALLFAALTSQRTAVALLVVLTVATPWRAGGEIAKIDRIEALATASAAPNGLPIVTGSGLRFFEIRENSGAGGRIVFLDTQTPSGDPTNRNQVKRWKAIDPALEVENAQAFLCKHPAFYLFAQPEDGGADELPAWLAGRADFTPPPVGRASLTLVQAWPCANRLG